MNELPAKTSIKPRELQGLLAVGNTARLLDVRTPGEFAAAHARDAALMPLGDLEAETVRRWRGPEAAPVYVFCQSGGRARRAIEKLDRAGVHSCILVEGGMQAWIDSGLPVERQPGGGLPLMRQVQITVGAVSAGGALLALTVNPLFAIIPLVMGAGLLFAGITGLCGLALVLAKMPWNRAKNCGTCCTAKTEAAS